MNVQKDTMENVNVLNFFLMRDYFGVQIVKLSNVSNVQKKIFQDQKNNKF